MCHDSPEMFHAWFAGVETLAGSSMGALLSVAFCACDPWEAQKYLCRGTFRALAECLMNDGVNGFLRHNALSNGEALDAMLVSGMKDLFHSENMTLGELEAVVHKRIILTATHLTTGAVEYLCGASHPDMPVWMAIRASVSLPGFFPAVRWKGGLYVDGGLACNIPLHLFPPEDTLTVFTHVAPREPDAFWFRLMDCALVARQMSSLRALPAHVLRCVPCIPASTLPSAYNFAVDTDTLGVLQRCGRLAWVIAWLRIQVLVVLAAIAMFRSQRRCK